jgi:general stress protein 26
MTPEQKEKINTILVENHYGVIATNAGEGSPQSAIVAVSSTPELEVVFGSFAANRKNQNILKNPNVSVVIGWDKIITVQLEGTARLIEGEQRIILEDAHCKKNVGSTKFRKDPRQQYYKITPNWIRYSNYSINPQEVWEVNL